MNSGGRSSRALAAAAATLFVLALSGCSGEPQSQTLQWLREQPWVASAEVSAASGPVPLPGKSAQVTAKVNAKSGTSYETLRGFRTEVQKFDAEQSRVQGISVDVTFGDDRVTISGDPGVNAMMFGLFDQGRADPRVSAVQVTREHDGPELAVTAPREHVLAVASGLTGRPAVPGEQTDILIEVGDGQDTTAATSRTAGAGAGVALLTAAAQRADAATKVRSFQATTRSSLPTLALELGGRDQVAPVFTDLRTQWPPDQLELRVGADKIAVRGAAASVDRLPPALPLADVPGVSGVEVGDKGVAVTVAAPDDVARAGAAIGANPAIGESVSLHQGRFGELQLTGSPGDVAATSGPAGAVAATATSSVGTYVEATGRSVDLSLSVRDDSDWVKISRAMRAAGWPGTLSFTLDARNFSARFDSTQTGEAEHFEVTKDLSGSRNSADAFRQAWNASATS